MMGGTDPNQKFAGKQTNSTKYADLNKYNSNGLITGVRVLWSDYIVGLEVSFGGQKSDTVVGYHNQNVWDENFNLAQGDHVIEIFGRAADVITCIGFRTSKGLTKIWGNPFDGEKFTFKLQGHFLRNLKLGVTEYLSYIEPIFEDEVYLYGTPLKLSNNGKWTEGLGKSRGGEDEFNDYDWVADKFNYEVAEVKIWHDGQFVYGIQFYYHMDGTKKTPGNHLVFANNLKTETLTLSEGEHITRAIIRSGDWVDGITLFTDKGRSVHAGGKGGHPWIVKLPDRHQIIATSGSTQQYLHTLTLYYDEIY